MKANQVTGHFDFVIGLLSKYHVWGLIGTHTIVSYACTYVMLIKQGLLLFLAPPQQITGTSTLSFFIDLERYV